MMSTRSCSTCTFMSLETMQPGQPKMMVCRHGPLSAVAMHSLIPIAPSVRQPDGGMQMQVTVTAMAPPVAPQQWCYRHIHVCEGCEKGWMFDGEEGVHQDPYSSRTVRCVALGG